jgi:DNA polymerase III, delta subunit
MTTSAQDIIKSIERRQIQPFYVLTGEEPFYIDRIAKAFEQELLDDGEKDFNQSVLYGKDTSIEEILTNAKQYPIMSQWRIVLVKEAQDIDKKQFAKFDTYFSCPIVSSVIILCYKYKKLDKSFLKQVEKAGGLIFESKPIYDNQVPSWTIKYAKEIGLTIKEDAAQLVSDYLGNNLEKIANELSKLKLNINAKEPITPKIIEDNIGISKDYNVFELQKALGVRDILKANKIVNYFENNPKENPIQMILPALFSYFTKVLIASEVKEKTSSAIAAAIGCNPYFAKDYITAINVYPYAKIIQIISLIREYDLKSKGLNVSPLTTNGELLRELIFKITH